MEHRLSSWTWGFLPSLESSFALPSHSQSHLPFQTASFFRQGHTAQIAMAFKSNHSVKLSAPWTDPQSTIRQLSAATQAGYGGMCVCVCVCFQLCSSSTLLSLAHCSGAGNMPWELKDLSKNKPQINQPLLSGAAVPWSVCTEKRGLLPLRCAQNL